MKDRRTKSLFRDESTRHPRYEGDCACTLPVGFIFNFKLNPPLLKFHYLLIIKGIAEVKCCDISCPRALRLRRSVSSRAFVVALLGSSSMCIISIITSKEVLFLCTGNYVW